jgi:hypothetical protein
MFEFIGLIIGTAVLLTVAAIFGAVLAVMVWFILPQQAARRKTLTWVTPLLPVAGVLYCLICIGLLPSESLFGDIDQPLPNGYRLTALGKMSDWAAISKDDDQWAQTGIKEWFGRVAVDGPLVVGQYSHPFGLVDQVSSKPYFVFDTKSGRAESFATLEALDARLGHPVQLVEVQFFRSQEASYVRQMRINSFIMYGPPTLLLAVYFALIWRVRRSTKSTS